LGHEAIAAPTNAAVATAKKMDFTFIVDIFLWKTILLLFVEVNVFVVGC
jgi:hypothetical protein